MTALNDAARASATLGQRRPSTPALSGADPRSSAGRYPTWLPSGGYLAAVIAIGGMQLLATMDSTVAIVGVAQDPGRAVACPMPGAAG